ncbi:NAD(P)-dependent oxidoreductase [Corynebacterium sp. S7]
MSLVPTIAFVGAGAIGFPMALRLQENADVIVVDPFEAARDRCREHGLDAVASVKDLPEVNHAIIMVANAEQVNQVVLEDNLAAKLPEDGVIVIMSTIGVEPIVQVSEALEGRGVYVIDSPVTGGVTGAEKGQLKMYASGPEEAVTAVRPYLQSFGEVLNIGTKPGHGQAAKLVNNLLVTTHVVVAAEALSFAEDLDLDLEAILGGLLGGAAYSWSLAEFGPEMLHDEPSKLRALLRIFMKDAELIESSAHNAGSYIPVLEAVNKVLVQAKEAGLGEKDSSRVIEVYRAQSHAPESSTS